MEITQSERTILYLGKIFTVAIVVVLPSPQTACRSRSGVSGAEITRSERIILYLEKNLIVLRFEKEREEEEEGTAEQVWSRGRGERERELAGRGEGSRRRRRERIERDERSEGSMEVRVKN